MYMYIFTHKMYNQTLFFVSKNGPAGPGPSFVEKENKNKNQKKKKLWNWKDREERKTERYVSYYPPTTALSQTHNPLPTNALLHIPSSSLVPSTLSPTFMGLFGFLHSWTPHRDPIQDSQYPIFP